MRRSWLTIPVLTKMSAMLAPRERKPPAVPAGTAGVSRLPSSCKACLGWTPSLTTGTTFAQGLEPMASNYKANSRSPVLMTMSGLKTWIAR